MKRNAVNIDVPRSCLQRFSSTSGPYFDSQHASRYTTILLSMSRDWGDQGTVLADASYVVYVQEILLSFHWVKSLNNALVVNITW